MHTRILSYLAIFLSSCSYSENKYFEYALELADKNAKELESIQRHYQNNKKKSTMSLFLINNMIGKQTVDSKSIEKSQLYFNSFIIYFNTQGRYKNDIQYIICDSIKQLYPYAESHPRYLSDLQHISADFLIRHIDYCFHIWQQYPWCKDIDFDTFCKYILPYTTSNCYWEQAADFFEQKYATLRDSVCHKSYKEIGKIIAEDIDKTFVQNWVLFSQKHKGLLPTTFENLAKAQIGTCLEANIYKIAALRANGIPAALNTFPNWGNANSPHFWTEIIGDEHIEKLYDNTQRPYISDSDILVDNIFWKNTYSPTVKDTLPHVSIQYCRTIPKVYRINYEIQQNCLALRAKEEIPDFFRNPGIEDITDKYIVCKDIEVPLWDNKHKKEYVYLCCYDDNNWIPVCWSIPRKKQALFTKVGVNMLYLPAYYENGAIIPAGNAFILKENGELKCFSEEADKKEISATFYSKTPYRLHTALQAAGTVGTRFSVCNKKDLSDSLNVYTIEKLPFYEDSFKIPTNKKYRYLVCDFQNTPAFQDAYSIAEIKIFGKNRQQLEGKLTGTKGISDNKLENVMDEDRVSFYQPDKSEKRQYIVFDLGQPREIEKVEFYPRSDDNRIVTGELYELFYWDKKWISLGRQYGKENRLAFHNIPQNALFRIHNHTRGKEHRPFTYEEGKQVWW
ncbi:hypothetical protein PRABACTJOHN_04291 [Parabacteroides johnsonii DSM 18315]|uniref:F5/8 type C domain protein n=2 Tax=Parabacteroides johnsonii TaxID=387661 RepID=B7BGU2_9BACT|nr:hypothetical protein PRABACTJOHN_04291 [Parabacteroides johnsonii DSM 18315]